MNKLFILFVALYFSNPAVCQCLPKAGEDIHLPELDKFEGTWQYVSGDTSAVIMLKKNHRPFTTADGTYHSDLLLGVYRVLVKGTIVFDNLHEITNLNRAKYPAYIVFAPDCHTFRPDFLRGTIRDVNRQKYVSGELIFIPGTIPRIFLHQFNPERFGLIDMNGKVISEDLLNPNGTFDPGFTIPTDAFYTRQL